MRSDDQSHGRSAGTNSEKSYLQWPYIVNIYSGALTFHNFNAGRGHRTNPHTLNSFFFLFTQGEVIARTPKGLTVDLNHPLAGETVVFELNLLSIDTGT